MVPKWRKITRKSPYQKQLLEAVEKILVGDFLHLDIVKLKSNMEKYRCRVGDMRIIFGRDIGGKYKILDIGWRGDIYKDL